MGGKEKGSITLDVENRKLSFGFRNTDENGPDELLMLFWGDSDRIFLTIWIICDKGEKIVGFRIRRSRTKNTN